MVVCAVEALRAIKKSLGDPYKNLARWNRRDPCTSNWTGIICYNRTLNDGYLHVSELYDFFHLKYHLFIILIMEFKSFHPRRIKLFPNDAFFVFASFNRTLYNRNLTGSLSPELGRLSYLKILWVTYFVF